MAYLRLDLETRSAVDLREAGLDNYANDPTTDVLCMTWALEDEPVQIFKVAGRDLEAYAGGANFMHPVYRWVEAGGTIVTNNAAFVIWNRIMSARHGWPALKPKQVQCAVHAST